MAILIIGSKGFIGKHCFDFFSKYDEVFGCDIYDSPEKKYLKITGSDDFFKLFSSQKFDICINASGSADVGFSLRNPEKDFELNVKNVERLIESIRKYSPNCKLINFSSAAVYGNPKSLPVNESAETNPLSAYGKHKLQSELLLKEYAKTYKLLTCSLRVFSAYGTGLKKQLFWDIYQKTLLGKTISLYGTGKESRDFIFIEDLISALVCVMKGAAFCGETINVASGTEIKIESAVFSFLKYLGNFKVVFSGDEKPGDPKNWRADITALNALGFSPSVPFEEGLKRTADSYKVS